MQFSHSLHHEVELIFEGVFIVVDGPLGPVDGGCRSRSRRGGGGGGGRGRRRRGSRRRRMSLFRHFQSRPWINISARKSERGIKIPSCRVISHWATDAFWVCLPSFSFLFVVYISIFDRHLFFLFGCKMDPFWICISMCG